MTPTQASDHASMWLFCFCVYCIDLRMAHILDTAYKTLATTCVNTFIYKIHKSHFQLTTRLNNVANGSGIDEHEIQYKWFNYNKCTPLGYVQMFLCFFSDLTSKEFLSIFLSSEFYLKRTHVVQRSDARRHNEMMWSVPVALLGHMLTYIGNIRFNIYINRIVWYRHINPIEFSDKRYDLNIAVNAIWWFLNLIRFEIENLLS